MTNEFYEIDELQISHSSRSMLRSCARKFEFRKFLQSGKYESSFAADVGQCLHTGYQDWLVNKDEERATIAMMLDFPIDTFYDESKNVQRGLEACYATLMRMIASDEFGRFELVYVKGLDGAEHPAVEVPFEIEITDFKSGGEIPIKFVGWIDAIVFDHHNQIFRVLDIKTHRNNYDDLSAKYHFDEQCLPYGLVIENIVGRAVDTFDVDYLSCYIDLLKPKVHRYAFPKTTDMIFDWAQGLYYDLRQIDQFYKTGWFPRATNGDVCFAYGRPCQYFDYCGYRDHNVLRQMISEDQRNLSPTDKRRGEWNPWVKVPLEFGVAG